MTTTRYKINLSDTDLKNNTNTISQDFTSMSFKDYKIDYNKCLGSGVYGTVYRVIPRPENEKGILSSMFPYIYDYFYRINKTNNDESRKYCIKIYKSAFRILCENINDPLPLFRPVQSFSEPSNEMKSNLILRKHGVSNIIFFKPNTYYSQFKTRVRGETFEYYFHNNYFTSPNQFLLRKNFVSLLSSLLKSDLCLSDVNKKNLMYDKYKNQWEIVDGEVKEVNPSEGLGLDDEEVSSWLHFLLPSGSSESIRQLFDKFYEFASSNEEYDQEKDLDVLQNLGLIPESPMKIYR